MLFLKKKFKKLHDENKAKILKEVSCTVYVDPKEADVWIGIKHGYGKPGVERMVGILCRSSVLEKKLKAKHQLQYKQ